MSVRGITEPVVVEAMLAWPENLGYKVEHGHTIGVGALATDHVESDSLVALRDAILPKLLSSEVRVKVLNDLKKGPFDGRD